ncbi:MAG: hypothetical protein R3321_04770 [Nitrososphaeraceae archaeon]|nr:hypothetical protein [Nitrososphaeraceae archaeon]
MRDIITIKYTDVAGAVPSASYLENGELALNRVEGIIFFKDVNGDIRPIGDASGAVVAPGGPYPEPGIGVSGTEFFVDDTVVRVDPDFVPDNPTPNIQTIKGIVNFSEEFPTTDAAGIASISTQLVNVYTLTQQRLEAHLNTTGSLATGNIYQYNASTTNWETVNFLDGGTF